MKKMYLLLLSLFFVFSVNQSCSSDEGNDGGGTPDVTSITISANQSSAIVGENITFTVRTNTNQNVTSAADIKVDNTSIGGSSYSASSAGTYNVKATYNGLTSNTISVTYSAPDFTSITLSLSDSEVEVGQSVSFTATGDNGADLTSQATFSVNGNAITGNSHTANTAGTYFVRARIGSISSNEMSYEAVNPPATSITLVASDENAFWGEEVTLSVQDNFGADVTSAATIYVDGAEWTGGTLTSNVDATFECYATMDALTSETVNVSFIEQPDTFVRNALVEDYTGTWCQYCPRVLYAIELLEAETEHAIPVGVHINDEMTRVNTTSLENLAGVTGYPTAMINRMTTWQTPESDNLDQITDIAGTETNIGLSINSTLSGSTVDADVKVSFADDYDDIKLVVYLVEDGLLYDQVNFYGNLYGGQNPIPNFEHNGVLSQVYTSLLGDDMPNSVAGEEYTKSYSESVPTAVQNNDNLQIVAFVIDANTNDVLNARRVPVGENGGYEYYN